MWVKQREDLTGGWSDAIEVMLRILSNKFAVSRINVTETKLEVEMVDSHITRFVVAANANRLGPLAQDVVKTHKNVDTWFRFFRGINGYDGYSRTKIKS